VLPDDRVRQRHRIEVEGRRGHLVDEGPVVTRDEHRAGPVPQELGEQVAARVIEVVRRLVEHQRVRRPQQQPAEGEASDLTTGEVAYPPVLGRPVDAETRDDLLDPVLQVPGVVPVRRLQCEPEAVSGAGVAGGEQSRLVLDRVGECPYRCDGVLQHLGDGPVAGERWLLMVEPDGTGHRDRPGVRLVQTGRDAQERGLAGAVLADETGDLAGGDDEGDIGEDPAVGEGPGDAIETQMVPRRERGAAERQPKG
jgi:hypothetical protein